MANEDKILNKFKTKFPRGSIICSKFGYHSRSRCIIVVDHFGYTDDSPQLKCFGYGLDCANTWRPAGTMFGICLEKDCVRYATRDEVELLYSVMLKNC